MEEPFFMEYQLRTISQKVQIGHLQKVFQSPRPLDEPANLFSPPILEALQAAM
jgi:hypothetical protein